MEWRCRKCGAYARVGEPVCGSCGTPFAEPAYRSGNSDPNAPLELEDIGPEPPRAPISMSSRSSIPGRRGAEAEAIARIREAEARRRSSRRTGIAVLLVVLAVASYSAYRVVRKIHMKARWDRDPSIPSAIAYAATLRSADESAVKTVCLALADRVEGIQRKLAMTPEPQQVEEAARQLRRWEFLDDARHAIAEKEMPTEAQQVMAKCTSISATMGEHIEAIAAGEAVGVDAEGLQGLVAEMRGAFPTAPRHE